MLASPMRGRGLIVLFAIVLVAIGAMHWAGLFAGGDLPQPAPSPEQPTAGSAAATGTRTESANTLAPGIVATRAEATPPPNKNIADAPTAWLRVIDLGSEKAIPGAPIRTVLAGSEIGFSDEQGLAPIPLREPEQLAVVVEGYLMRLVPTRPGSTEQEPQVVRLVRDDWSIVRRFEWTTKDGASVGEVFVRFRPSGRPPKNAPPVPQNDAVLQRAWSEHCLLATRPVCADVPVQLGTFNADRVHRLGDSSSVRFVGPGEFTIEAATTTGLVARQDIRIDATPRTNAPSLRVQLEPGEWASGTVLDVGSGAPIANAKITLQDGEPLGLLATTAKDGNFRFGPLLPGRLTLHVNHDDHEPLAFGPLQTPIVEARIMLQPLPATTLRGRVRARPQLQPLADATVQWVTPHGSPLVARTGADGTFVLRAKGSGDGRLAVQAVGYLGYAELVTPGAPFQDYDVWPSTTVERLAGGLSALLEGIVVDAEGRPAADVDVRWQPDAPTPPAMVPGRRVLEGALLDLPLTTRTGKDGAFRLETNQFGLGRITLTEGTSGTEVTAIAGQTKNGIRLRR